MNEWIGRENIFFLRTLFSTKSFLYRRKITECCKTQHKLAYLGIIWFRERKTVFLERNPPPRHTVDTTLWASLSQRHPPSPLCPGAEVKDWWSWRVSDNLPNHTSLLLLLPRLPAQLLLLCAHHHFLPPSQEPPCSSCTPVPASSSLPRSVCHYCSWTGTWEVRRGKKKHPDWNFTCGFSPCEEDTASNRSFPGIMDNFAKSCSSI